MKKLKTTIIDFGHREDYLNTDSWYDYIHTIAIWNVDFSISHKDKKVYLVEIAHEDIFNSRLSKDFEKVKQAFGARIISESFEDVTSPS